MKHLGMTFQSAHFKLEYSSTRKGDTGIIVFDHESVAILKDKVTPLEWTQNLENAILAVENLHETFTHIGPAHLNAIDRDCVSRICRYLYDPVGDINLSSILHMAEEIIKDELELFEKQNSSTTANSEGTKEGTSQDDSTVDESELAYHGREYISNGERG